MIDVGLARLAKTIQEAIEDAPSRDPGPARLAVDQALREQPRIVLGAWDALRTRGRQFERRELQAVEWARAIIDAALAAVEISANEDSRRAAAQRLVDLFATALERQDPGPDGLD